MNLREQFEKEMNFGVSDDFAALWHYAQWLEKKLSQSTQMINSVQEENKVLQSENQQFQDMIEKGLTFEDLKNDSE